MRGDLVEDIQTVKPELDLTLTQSGAIDTNGELIWKSLFSRSYTLNFHCENCGNLVEVDGWFYKFDEQHCSECGTGYAGFFGRVLLPKHDAVKFSHNHDIQFETFDGQVVEINQSTLTTKFRSIVGHIVLVIYKANSRERRSIWCVVDWFSKDQAPQYLSADTIKLGNKGTVKEKKKTIPSILLVGIVMTIVLCGLMAFLSPVMNMF